MSLKLEIKGNNGHRSAFKARGLVRPGQVKRKGRLIFQVSLKSRLKRNPQENRVGIQSFVTSEGFGCMV